MEMRAFYDSAVGLRKARAWAVQQEADRRLCFKQNRATAVLPFFLAGCIPGCLRLPLVVQWVSPQNPAASQT